MDINVACLPENYSTTFYLDLFSRYPKTFVVAVADGSVQGYIMCRIERSFSKLKSLHLTKLCHIVSLAVMEPYRNRGIATSLMSQALKDAAEEYEATECFLEVRVSNDPAISLYKKIGFRNTRRMAGYYMNGEDAWEMAKPLVEDEQTISGVV